MNEQTTTDNLLSAGVDINIPMYSALNLALALSIPVVVTMLLLIFHNKIK